MRWLLRRAYVIPASEPTLVLALTLALLMMAGLLWGIVWQGGVIEYQRGLIHDLWQDLHHS